MQEMLKYVFAVINLYVKDVLHIGGKVVLMDMRAKGVIVL